MHIFETRTHYQTDTALETHHVHLEVKWGVEYLFSSANYLFVFEAVSVLKDVVMENLCACADFLVFCIHFNLYNHSNCVISTEDPRNYHFHSVLLTETVQGLVLCFCALHGWKYMSKYKKTAVWPLAFCIAPLVSDEYSIFYGVHSVSYFHWFTFTLRISNVVKRLLNSSENKSYVTVWDTVKYSSLKFTFLLTRQ
jgi:hypothetical protein